MSPLQLPRSGKVAGIVLALLLALLPRHADASDCRSWGWLIDKLAADGVPRARAERTFGDPRMPAFDGLGFSIDPREPHSMYRRFLQASAVMGARRCYAAHEEAFLRAQREHGVPASVLAAIIYVESGCGRNTGSSVILYRLARLAMANEPANLADNVERMAPGDPERAARVEARARYLEETFYPEVLATFRLADRMRVNPLDILGSGSGAFGNAQFLPSKYFAHGADGDGDGRVDLYETADAAASCANYLSAYGWQPGINESGKRAVIWHYNRSDAYVDTILGLARRIDVPYDPGPTVSRARPARTKGKLARAKPVKGKQVAKPAKSAPAPKRTVTKRRKPAAS